MDLSLVTNSSKQLGRVLTRNSPTILTAIGVGGLLTTVILAVKGTVRAQEILWREADFRRNDWSRQTGESEESYPIDPILNTEEIIELTWKCYIPTFVMGVATATCIIGANSINLRRNAALASLFSVTETALKEYQAKVVETIGKNKEEKIRGEIAQDKVTANPVNEKAVILTGKGEYLCLDTFSGRYFRSNIDAIQRSENKFNQRLLREGWLDINEFYDELGLAPIELGNQMGWVAQYAILELRFNVTMSKDGEPCLVMEYMVQPKQI